MSKSLSRAQLRFRMLCSKGEKPELATLGVAPTAQEFVQPRRALEQGVCARNLSCSAP